MLLLSCSGWLLLFMHFISCIQFGFLKWKRSVIHLFRVISQRELFGMQLKADFLIAERISADGRWLSIYLRGPSIWENGQVGPIDIYSDSGCIRQIHAAQSAAPELKNANANVVFSR